MRAGLPTSVECKSFLAADDVIRYWRYWCHSGLFLWPLVISSIFIFILASGIPSSVDAQVSHDDCSSSCRFWYLWLNTLKMLDLVVDVLDPIHCSSLCSRSESERLLESLKLFWTNFAIDLDYLCWGVFDFFVADWTLMFSIVVTLPFNGLFLCYVCNLDVHGSSSVRLWDLLCSSRAYRVAETWQHNPDLPGAHLQKAWVGVLLCRNDIHNGPAGLPSILGLTNAFTNS